jgi:SAM-dependent methyltransferase
MLENVIKIARRLRSTGVLPTARSALGRLEASIAPAVRNLVAEVAGRPRDTSQTATGVVFPSTPSGREWGQCCIDRLNGAHVSIPKTPAEIAVHPNGVLHISGWAYDGSRGEADGAVRVVIDGRAWPAYYGDERPDVGEAHQVEGIRYCGFRLEAPVSRIGAGRHRVLIELASAKTGELLRSAPGAFVLHLDPACPPRDEERYDLWGTQVSVKAADARVDASQIDRMSSESVAAAFVAFNNVCLRLAKSPYLRANSLHVSEAGAYPAIHAQVVRSGIPLESYTCDTKEFNRFLELSLPLYRSASYPAMYGGERGYFLEKAFEHFLSCEYLGWAPSDRIMDLACWISPARDVLRQYRPAELYAHDITLKTDLARKTISGFAHRIEAPDNYFDAIIAHCAIDNFEGDADTAVFREAARILKPGGRILITPLHLAARFENVVALGSPGIQIDPGAHIVMREPGTLRFGRHYSVAALRARIIAQVPALKFHLVHVTNAPEAEHPPTKAGRYMLIGTKSRERG